MAEKLEFNLVVLEDGKEVLRKLLAYEEVESLVSNVSDTEDNADLFGLAARHPASAVRERVADKEHLPDAMVKLLSADKSIEVLRTVVDSEKFKAQATNEQLEKLLALDDRIAQKIANTVERFPEADTLQLASAVAAHSDPAVVYSLADNSGTPKRILKTLLNHSDPRVVHAARETLKNSR